MTGRGRKAYYRQDNGRLITDEDKYLMLMLYQHQRYSIPKLSKRFSLEEAKVRTIIGKRSGGSCCG